MLAHWECSLIPSPAFLSKLAVFSGHSSFSTPSGLNCFQNLFLNFLLFRTDFTYHTNEHWRAVEPFSQFPSAPGHRIIKSESANFLYIGRCQMVFLLCRLLENSGKTICILLVLGCIGAQRSSNIIGGEEFRRSVINGGSARRWVVNNVILKLVQWWAKWCIRLNT